MRFDFCGHSGYTISMTTQTISKQNRTTAKRLVAIRQLEAWEKRNAKYLKNWRAGEVLRAWRSERWSSSTPR